MAREIEGEYQRETTSNIKDATLKCSFEVDDADIN
jgi:hypothetical protein